MLTLTTYIKKSNMLNLILSMLAFSMLSGCGFHLRGSHILPEQLQTLKVTSVDKHGELTRLVKEHLTINQVDVVNVATDKIVPELRILKDTLDRRTLSVFPNGQVAEYELIYTVKYQLLFDDKAPQNYSFELNRDYQDDPDLALAKSRELTLLLNEMRKIAADRILRDMASVH